MGWKERKRQADAARQHQDRHHEPRRADNSGEGLAPLPLPKYTNRGPHTDRDTEGTRRHSRERYLVPRSLL